MFLAGVEQVSSVLLPGLKLNKKPRYGSRTGVPRNRYTNSVFYGKKVLALVLAGPAVIGINTLYHFTSSFESSHDLMKKCKIHFDKRGKLVHPRKQL